MAVKFGEFIQGLSGDLGMSYADFARVMGMNDRTLRIWRERSTAPRGALGKLSRRFNVPASELEEAIEDGGKLKRALRARIGTAPAHVSIFLDAADAERLANYAHGLGVSDAEAAKALMLESLHAKADGGNREMLLRK